jgi:K+/H+ antiporter YhaU regulatory subunit KhtT
MKYFCTKGKHIHSTQKEADNCFICKRKAERREKKVFKREDMEELSDLLSLQTEEIQA